VRRLRPAGGFTLIEVLVALVIVAVGMAAVLSALSSSANTLSFLRDETFAQWLALNQIATIRISGQQPPTGTTDGDTDFGGRSWHWRREVVSTEVPGVVRIDVKVRPKEIKAGDDEAWTTTVSGISGNAVGVPDGYNPSWGAQTPRYAANQGINPATGTGTGIGTSGTNIQISPSTSDTGLGSTPDSGLGSPTPTPSPDTLLSPTPQSPQQ
jgi:general secretion pathway protein I